MFDHFLCGFSAEWFILFCVHCLKFKPLRLTVNAPEEWVYITL